MLKGPHTPLSQATKRVYLKLMFQSNLRKDGSAKDYQLPFP